MLVSAKPLLARYSLQLLLAGLFGGGLVIPCLSAAIANESAPIAQVATPRAWPTDAFLPLTEKRIAALPASEQTAWLAYWQASRALAKLTANRETTDRSPPKRAPGEPTGASRSRGLRLRATAAWYASPEAHDIADHVTRWQSAAGAWSKSGDYLRDPQPSDDRWSVWSAGTFDNHSTTGELRFLALVISANAAEPRVHVWRDSFQRGFDYMLAAQFPNGGFPQIYPLVGSYHDAITFNDDAFVHVLEIFREIGAQRAPFAFVSSEQAAIARTRVDRGVACILATQIKNADGLPTLWGQQHDPLTLQPCAARNFEPIAFSAAESTGLVEFLLTVPRPTPEVVAAIEGAMNWLAAHALREVEWDRTAMEGAGLVARPNGADLWARFYEIDTGKPIFADRDRSVHYTVTEISAERRRGYAWYITRPESLPAAYAAWKKKLAKS